MLAGISRASAAELVAQGGVTVDGRVVSTRSHRLADGAVLELEVPERREMELVPDPAVGVPVVYEDVDLLVVDKPAGLVVHPGAGRTAGTLVHGLLARYPEIAEVGAGDRPGIVHRLDRGTSGLMLVARSARAYEALVEMFQRRRVVRRYRALVWGAVESPAGMIEAPVGRSGRDRTRMAVTLRGRPAVTRYEVAARFCEPAEVTELVCALATGRTHQIRVHMASIGHPVVGDERYGGHRSSAPEALALSRPWLHAEHLALDHPVSGEHLELDSPVPGELQHVLAELS